jgi:hypothetical protein
MTPDPSTLLQRLARPLDIDGELVGDVRQFFLARGQPPLARWMDLEVKGYAPETSADSFDIQRALGAEAPSWVVDAIRRGRVRSGFCRAGRRIIEWPHFFVESIADLGKVAVKLTGGGVSWIEFSFDVPPGSPSPRVVSFRRDVLSDVLASIALEIADAVRRVPP